MNILDKIFKIKKNDPIKEIVNDVQSVIDETDSEKETARKQAIELALKLIEENPDMPVKELIPKLNEHSSLTHSEIGEIIIKLPEIKSEKAVIAAVQATDLPPETIATIASEANISTDTAEKIVEEIQDKDIQKEQQIRIAHERENETLNQLSNVYKKCDNIEAPNLVEILEAIDIRDYTEKINKKIMSIMAKRSALDCMKFGGPRIPTLARAVSSLDMFEYDLPYLTCNEYKILKKDFDKEKKPYKEFTNATKKLIHDKILEDIAKTLAKNYDTVGDFGVPQTEKFKNLKNPDIEKIISTVQTYSETIDRLALKRLTSQLNGKTDTLLENAFKAIELNIRELPDDEQLPTALAIQETLEQRMEAIQLVNKAKRNSLETHSSNNDGR